MTEDIFDKSNVRIFKEIEKKKMGDVYTLLGIRSAELGKAFGLRNLFQNICSDTSRVQDCWNFTETRVRRKTKYALRPNTA